MDKETSFLDFIGWLSIGISSFLLVDEWETPSFIFDALALDGNSGGWFNQYQTFFSALIALAVGVITVRVVNKQIRTGLEQEHIQRTIDAGIYLSAVKDFLDKVSKCLLYELVQENINERNIFNSNIQLDEHDLERMMKFPLPEIIFHWEYLSKIPPNNISQFLAIRSAVMDLQSYRKEFRKAQIKEGKYCIQAIRWKMYIDAYFNARHVFRENSSLIEKHTSFLK